VIREEDREAIIRYVLREQRVALRERMTPSSRVTPGPARR